MRGERIPLSRIRVTVNDLLDLSRDFPSIPVQRTINVSAVLQARSELADRPSWTALFTKAYAIVSDEFPQLRRAFIKLPSPHLRQYPTSVACIAFEREFEGDVGVLTARIKNPARMPLRNLTRRLQRFTTDPVERVHDFRRLLTLAKYPRWVRRIVLSLALNSPRHKRNHFGTFSVSVYSGLGAESLHPIAPVTSVLNYGVIGTGGMVFVRVIYDHRVLDGATIARALARLEAVLAEQIVPELHSLKATEQRGVG